MQPKNNKIGLSLAAAFMIVALIGSVIFFTTYGKNEIKAAEIDQNLLASLIQTEVNKNLKEEVLNEMVENTIKNYMEEEILAGMIQSNVQSYLKEDVLATMIEQGIEAYIRKQIEQQNVAAAQGSELQDFDKISQDEHIRGDKNARITLIEYSDFDCPYCRKFHSTAIQIVEDYKGRVNWAYRHFPLSGHEPLASQKSQASECVAEFGGNDKFWEFTDALYENTNIKSVDAIIELASEIGVNSSKIEKCLQDGKYQEKVASQMQGGAKAGIGGTPGNILFDSKSGKAVLISGAQPISVFKEAIDEMLKL